MGINAEDKIRESLEDIFRCLNDVKKWNPIKEQRGQAQVFKYFYQEESHEGQSHEGQVFTLHIREETGGRIGIEKTNHQKRYIIEV